MKSRFLPQTTTHELKNGLKIKVRELSAARFQEVVAPSQVDDPKKKKLATNELPFVLISSCVTTEEDEEFSLDEAREMGNGMVSELSSIILRVHGLGNQAEAEAKNE